MIKVKDVLEANISQSRYSIEFLPVIIKSPPSDEVGLLILNSTACPNCYEKEMNGKGYLYEGT